MAGSHGKLGEAGQTLLPEPPEGINPETSASRTVRKPVPVFKATAFAALCYGNPEKQRRRPSCHSKKPKHKPEPQPKALSHQSGPLSPPSPRPSSPLGRHCPHRLPSAPSPRQPGSLDIHSTPGLKCPSLLPSQAWPSSSGPGSSVAPRGCRCLPQQLPRDALPRPWSVPFPAATGPVCVGSVGMNTSGWVCGYVGGSQNKPARCLTEKRICQDPAFIFIFIYFLVLRSWKHSNTDRVWSGWSKLLFHLLVLKSLSMYCPWIEDVSGIKLMRTDTALDLSQKAEKRQVPAFQTFLRHAPVEFLTLNLTSNCEKPNEVRPEWQISPPKNQESYLITSF